MKKYLPKRQADQDQAPALAKMRWNKYRRWYNQIMGHAKKRTLVSYSERHHIKPKSLGGTNDKANIVRLTYREHFLAHWLLIKFTTGWNKRRMCYALTRMGFSNETGKISSGWQYEISKRAKVLASKGYSHSTETKMKMSIAHKGRPVPEERRKRISKTLMGHKGCCHTEEGRRKISLASSKNKIGNTFMLGKTHSNKTKLKMSIAAKLLTPRRGWSHSQETKLKMSESARRRYAN